MRFFFDRCMSIKLCCMVKILETGAHSLDHHDDDPRFTPNTRDTDWIRIISSDAIQPVVITGDEKILKRADEVKAIQESGLTFFILTDHWAKFDAYEQSWRFLKVWPEIAATAVTREPTVFMVNGGKSLRVEKHSRTKDIRR